VENERAAGEIYNVGEQVAGDMQSWIQELGDDPASRQTFHVI
jgi:hypothetical protein